MEKDTIENQIIQLIALIASKRLIEAKEKIEAILEQINDKLDFATTDEELVRLGKYHKIVEQLQQKAEL